MLRKFTNHPREEDALRESKRHTIRGFWGAIIIFLVIGLVGITLFAFRDPLEQAYSHISAGVRTSLARHPTLEEGARSFLQTLNEIWPGSKSSSPSLPLPEQHERVNDFLYTVELTSGGKVEGKIIELGEAVVTVTDEKGMQIRVPRGDVRRISKIRL